MNKKIILGMFVLLNLFISFHAKSAFVLNGTRFIYDEGRKNISVEINNKSKEMYGGQVWVSNTMQPDSEVFFTPTPSFFKIGGGGDEKQVIRLLNINPTLPHDRESLFWLNVQEIPPVSKDGENVLAIALNTQVKLFYRPKLLKEGRNGAEQNLEIKGSVIKNPTPYYFAITGIKVNGQDLKLSRELDGQLSLFKPFSEINLEKKLSGIIVVEAIDDYGARRQYTLNSSGK